MRLKVCGLLAAFACAPLAQAQEHMTQGPVWTLACFEMRRFIRSSWAREVTLKPME